MVFEKYLEENATLINEELDLILSEFLNETKKTNIKLLPFALGLLNSTRGGKRIRGVLVKLGFEIASPAYGEARNDVLKVAAAYEILHAGFLIHDDIMDESTVRRGQPSLYQSLGGMHQGISQAISVGDIALYLPIKLISETNFLGDYKLKALNQLSEIVMNTGWGQILDMEPNSAEASRDKEFIYLFKTAKYTIAGPLQIGAILGEMDPTSPEFRGIKEFGENLGIAYQLQDDILDKEVESLDEARQEALKYSSLAKGMIEQITDDLGTRKLLEEMCTYLVERSK